MNGGIATGMGVGFAQMFDTFRYTQAIQRQLEINEAKERQEQQEIASILAKYNPEGMRDRDMDAFYKDYNELKSLYITNKGLYSHPADHPEDFAKAQAIEQRLRTRAAMSKEFKALEGKIGQDLYKDRNKFQPGTFDQWKRYGSMSIDEIMNERGGVLPGYQDLEYRPIEPDYEKWQKRAASMSGMSEPKSTVIRGTGEAGNGIQIGYAQTRTDKVIKPEAFSILVNGMWAEDGEDKRWYANSFDKLTPEHIAEVQENVDKILGPDSTFKVRDAKSLAFADLLVRGHTIPGQTNLVKDVQYEDSREDMKYRRDRADKVADRNLQHQWDLEKEARMKEHDMNKIAARNQGKQQAENEFNKNISDFKTALRKGDKATYKRISHSLIGFKKQADDPRVIDPKEVSEAAFLSYIKTANKSTDKAKQFQIPEDVAKKLYKNGTPVLVLSAIADETDPNGNPIVRKMLFNPESSGFEELIKPIFKDAKVELTRSDKSEGVDEE